MRLDYEIVARGIAKSRERAKESIKNGDIRVNGSVCLKPAYDVNENDEIIFTGKALKYAGRGGLKLEKALEFFRIDVKGLVCLDIGASTGGFTDCMLENGAEKVYAVEVGHGQLIERLVCDSRVVNMEKTDIRNVENDIFEIMPQFVCTDVSFISLRLIIPHIYRLMDSKGSAVVLVKPQFEAGKSNIGKNGIVKSHKVHIKVLEDIMHFCTETGFFIRGICASPIKGGSGNTEYLLCLDRKSGKNVVCDIKAVVSEALQRS